MLRRFAPVFACLVAFCFAAQKSPAQLTIESIASGSLTGRPPESLQWSPDGTRVTYIQRDDSGEHAQLWSLDTKTGERSVLVSEDKLQLLAPPASKLSNERAREWQRRYNVAAYEWAPDGQSLLFNANGQLWLYSLKTGTGIQLTSSSDPSSDPKFSPDGKNLVYVRKHNLWIRTIKSEDDERQLTKSGDDLLNGEVAWVYAEELKVRSNYFWSPDSRQIAYLQMNEKQVPEYPITDYGPTHATADKQKYPNPGDPNPEVRLGVAELSGHTKWINIPDTKGAYIPRFGWVRPGMLWVQVLNRTQDKLVLYFVEVPENRAHPMLTETSNAWVNVNDDFRVLKSGDRFLWASWRDGHTHLYLYSFDKSNPAASEAKLVAQLTKGDFETFGIDFVDENAGVVYFTADPHDPRQRQLFSVKLDGTGMKQITEQPGTHAASFGQLPSTYVDRFSALMTPPKLSFCRQGAGCKPFFESHDISSLHLTPPRWLELIAADGKTKLYGQLFLPLGTMDPSVRYPVILHPYGGPSGQSVRDEWGGAGVLFQEYLARKGFAVLVVDNRGMANRGRDFNAFLKGRFGDIELADQLASLDQVLKSDRILDGSRIGMYGASYGGFMVLYSMTHTDRIKAGVAIAPVANWRLYDTIYTERYLGLPDKNESGYKLSSPTNFAAHLSGALRIAHGTSDDNVHIQNTVEMTEALIKAGKQFDLMLYPGKTHGISGPDATGNLFHSIEDHFTRELKATPSAGEQAQ